MTSPAVCLRPSTVLLSSLLALGMMTSVAHAQDIGSIGGSLSDSTQTQGLVTDYGQGAGTIGATLQQGVTDATHAQAQGSAVSPTDDAYVSDAYDSTAEAGGRVESAFGSGAGKSGGQPGPSFVLNGLGSGTRQFSQNNGFGVASQRVAFVGEGTRAAFTSSLGTDSGALTPAAGKGRRSAQTSGTLGALLPDEDPVLSNSTEDLQLGSVPPTPSTTATAYFAIPYSMQPQYQYDDGQTPLLGRAAQVPGQILGTSAIYGVSPGGFPDSTLGLAALPSEASVSAPPAALVRGSGEGPLFPPVSEGTVFKVTAGVHPSLHAAPATPFREPFNAYEEGLVQKRILAGMSASQAESMREGDRAEYARSGRHRRKNDLSTEENHGDTALVPTIR